MKRNQRITDAVLREAFIAGQREVWRVYEKLRPPPKGWNHKWSSPEQKFKADKPMILAGIRAAAKVILRHVTNL